MHFACEFAPLMIQTLTLSRPCTSHWMFLFVLSDEYVTASMDEVMTSADEDPHNSTGSFSENAWDNYQVG